MTRKQKKITINKTHVRVALPYTCIGTLGLVMLGLLLPLAPGESQATAGGEILASAKVQPMLAVALDDQVSVDIIPTGEGVFEAGSGRLTIATNSPNGYSVYANAKDSNTLMNVNEKLTQEITAIEGSKTGEGFSNNTWGVSVGTTPGSKKSMYQGVALGEEKTSPLYAPSSSGGKEELYLGLGTKVDTNLPAGQYTNTITVSVIANPLDVTSLLQLVYMQDMTNDICTKTGEISVGSEITKRLIDIRDGKQYWVAKLADQNCWMTQNLALDLTAGETLSPATSDVSRDWTVPISTSREVPREMGTIAADSPENWNTRSWNLGEYVLAVPASLDICLASAPVEGSSATDNWLSVRYGQSLDRCKNVQDVSSADWQPNFTAQDGTWQGNRTYIAAQETSINTGVYDSHYLAGNFYQFNAATAGSGGKDVVSPESANTDANALVNATDSICPKGWQLPKDGRNLITGQPFDIEGGFYRLLHAYGYPETGKWGLAAGQGVVSANDSGYQNIAKSPLYFTRIGTVNEFGSIGYVGLYSNVWSSTTTLQNNRAFLFSSDGNIRPSDDTVRFVGLSVRCLAR